MDLPGDVSAVVVHPNRAQDRSVPANYRSIDFVIPPSTPAPPSRDDVLELLRAVVDPELGADIVSLGMVPS
ncbi:MAG: DUF59 domain-containing protein, partial [Ilumatobacter sp.]|nr:DUF59 domain-containing protein [Ilumatobacter sp.]MCB0985336.1 DUF59 domain-containing protein [Ilumatobacter sp.]